MAALNAAEHGNFEVKDLRLPQTSSSSFRLVPLRIPTGWFSPAPGTVKSQECYLYPKSLGILGKNPILSAPPFTRQ